MITTDQVMKMEFWPKLKRALDAALEDCRKEWPESKVEMIDKRTCWHIEVDGDPIMEIDCISLTQGEC